MKRTQKATWFVAGMLCTAMLVNTVAPAAAALVAKTIQVYTGIEVFVDDVKIDAGETHGNPDAFAYNGTTYVAVAAISKSLGENVIWDGENQRVYIGEHEGSVTYLLDVCEPYSYSGKGYSQPEVFSMAGKDYTHGFMMSFDAWAIWNLDGKYDTLEFDVGYVKDNVRNRDVYIYLDGELEKILHLDADALPEHVKIDLNSALQMKIVNVLPEGVPGNTSKYGFANVMVS